MSKQSDTTGLFFDRLRLVLNNFEDAHWLGENSPLAAPYFLGEALSGAAEADTPIGRGHILQQVIQATADSLWDGPLPRSREELETAVQAARQEHGNTGNRYHFLLLELRYLRRYFRPRAHPAADSEQAIRDYLGVGRGPYFNHLKTARETLGEALINQLQPTFRPEQPPQFSNDLIGRAHVLARCLNRLQAHRTVAITGMGGVGKTTLAAALAAQWPAPALFWFTFRPTLNDQLNSLLFSLGFFLHQHGASGLWLQLVADNGKIENPHVALEQARGDLHALSPRPLLCFDEVDYLAADADKTTPAQQQLLTFLESLHGLTPLLLVGQRVDLLADDHVVLEGLTLAQTQALLAQSQVAHETAEAARLHTYTDGNARMIWLCAALCQNGRTLSEVLDSLPETAVFQASFARLWQGLTAAEQALLRRIAVFRSPAPEDAFPQATPVIDSLASRHILQRDGRGAISLIPLMHDLIYEDRQRLPAEERERAHLAAATIRAERGEYTAAAFHFAQAGEPATAVQVWYPHRQQEIKRGQASAALAVFAQLSQRRLPEEEAQALALLRAELYQLAGESEQGLATLNEVNWLDNSETAVQAQLLRGAFLNSLGQPHVALEKLEDGLNAIAHLLQQTVRFRQQRAFIHIQQWQMPEAMQEVRLAQYTTEHLQGFVQKNLGNYEEAYLAFHKALALARSTGHEAGMAQTNRELADVLILQSRLDEARLHLQAALDYYEAIGDRLNQEKARSALLGIHFQAGDFEQVIAIGQTLLPFYERVKIPYYAGVTAANLAEAYYEIGDLAQAEFYAFKTLALEETHPLPYALYTLGLVRRAQERPDRAEQYLRQSQEIAANNADGFMEAYALRLLSEVLADQGKQEEAAQTGRQALRQFEHLNIPAEIKTTQELLERLAA